MSILSVFVHFYCEMKAKIQVKSVFILRTVLLYATLKDTCPLGSRRDIILWGGETGTSNRTFLIISMVDKS